MWIHHFRPVNIRMLGAFVRFKGKPKVRRNALQLVLIDRCMKRTLFNCFLQARMTSSSFSTSQRHKPLSFSNLGCQINAELPFSDSTICGSDEALRSKTRDMISWSYTCNQRISTLSVLSRILSMCNIYVVVLICVKFSLCMK